MLDWNVIHVSRKFIFSGKLPLRPTLVSANGGVILRSEGQRSSSLEPKMSKSFFANIFFKMDRFTSN